MRPLRHGLLEACRVAHGFGVRGFRGPARLQRPRQVHGAGVVSAQQCASLPEADAVVSRTAGVPIGVLTADCLPILLAEAGGSAVAAIHAGWRGLARGVIEAGVDALRHAAGPDASLVAVVGPHIGRCCYEIDGPVIEALSERFGSVLEDALSPAARAGRSLLDLGALARFALESAGLRPQALGTLSGACTCCDAVRFHSYRRDGRRCGRLVHFVAARGEG